MIKPIAQPKPISEIDFSSFPSPCYVLDESRLRRNMEILDRVQLESGAKIICALKGYSLWASFGIIKQYLHGTTASGLYEAKLGHEEFGGEVHVYSPAFTEDDMGEILEVADHIFYRITDDICGIVSAAGVDASAIVQGQAGVLDAITCHGTACSNENANVSCIGNDIVLNYRILTGANRAV